jgi:hypothetical protein
MPRKVVLRAILLLAVLARSAGAADRGTPPVDESGRPVREKTGRISYLPADERGGSISHLSGPRPRSASDITYVHGIGTRPAPQKDQPIPAPLLDPGLMREDGILGSIPQVLGTTGIFAVDVDGDGTDEILVGHSMLWYLLELDRSRNTWVQRYFGEKGVGATFGGGGVLCLRIGDLNGDGHKDLVVLTSANAFETYDLVTGAFLGTQTPGFTGITRFALANIDGGSDDEILAINAQNLAAIKNGVALPLWTVTGANASDLAVGNMDGDAALEIALARGTGVNGWVIDAATREKQFDYGPGFGNLVSAGDIDGDGRDELAAVETWGDYMAFDVEASSLKWSAYNFNTSAIRIADTDGDGISEVLVGDAQWGDVQVLDGVSGALRYAIANPEHSVSFIAVGDVRGTCVPKIIWGAGYTSTGADHLYIASTTSHTIEWENLETDGPFWSIAAGDTDADGRTELIRVSADSKAGYDGALVFVTDFHHRLDEYTPAASTNDGWMITRGMALEQLDSDPQLEYVMNDSSTYSGKVSAFDAVSHQRQWTSGIYDGEYVSCIVSGDPDGDGTTNILVGTGREHTGATGIYVRLYDGTTGTQIWRSPSLGGGFNEVTALRVANVDGTGNNEILAAVPGTGIMAFDGITHQLSWTHALTTVTALETGDVDANGVPEYIVGTSSGSVTAYNGATRTQVWTSSVSGAVTAVRLADVDGDATRELVVAYATGEWSYVAIIRLSDHAVQWTSPALAGTAGQGESLLVRDIDDDGRVEITIGSSHSVRVFEYSGAPETTAPVFPSGTPGVASAASASTACCVAVDLTWPLANDAASPPVTYRIYRSTTPGVIPGPSTYVGATSRDSYRDHTVGANVTYSYLVRAVDRLGNEDQNAHEISIVPNSISAEALPASKTVCPSGVLSLTAVASGGGTLTYQWSKNNAPIDGATQATYSVQSASPAHDGSYTCAIADSCGSSVTLGPVVVTVEWQRGDVNRDCLLSNADLSFLADHLVGAGPAPPESSGDTNHDGVLNTMDLFYLFGYLYNGGLMP